MQYQRAIYLGYTRSSLVKSHSSSELADRLED